MTAPAQLTATSVLISPTRELAEPTAEATTDRIAFSSLRDGNSEVYVMNADGSNQTNLTNNPAGYGTFAWSPVP